MPPRPARTIACRLGAPALLAGLLSATGAESGGTYHYHVDLTKSDDDCFHVTLELPPAKEKQATFQFAATVPGTYQIQNWGRLVSKFTALDKKGGKLEVAKDGDNRYLIAGADALASISYTVEDSMDSPIASKDIYPMAATNIEPDNIFINTFGVYGYLEGRRDATFETGYRLPAGWISAAALPQRKGKDEIIYIAKNYDLLADSPVLIGKLDIGTIPVAKATVMIAISSSGGGSGTLQAAKLCQALKPMLDATARYLDGLPVDKYGFLIHARNQRMELYGALEHMRSSLYTVPAGMGVDAFLDMSAHEFFHIVTPLNLRSTIIDHFAFDTPTPSRHLWLYEGITEYASHHLQAKAGMITATDFCAVISKKFAGARQYREDLPFTELSLGCYDKYEKEYGNVYQKGALLGMALDLELLRLSKGKMALRDLLLRLIKRFGPDKPFAEDELFGIMAECSFPEIADFLERHMAGSEPPPYAELLDQVGIECHPETGAVTLMTPSAEQAKMRKRWLTYEAEGR